MKSSLLLFAVLLCGCAAYRMTQAFNGPGVEPYLKTGTASISGEAYFKGDDRQTHFPDEPVTLVPDDPYMREYAVRIRSRREIVSQGNNPARYMRQVTPSGSGRFTFTNLPPGNYFLQSVVVWREPAFLNPNHTHETFLTKEITLREGEHVDVTLNKRR